MNESHQQIRSIFGRAIEIESPAERRAFIAKACGGDAQLLSEVQALLAAFENVGSFMEHAPELKRDPDADPGKPTGSLARDSSSTTDFGGPHQVGSRIGPYRLMEMIGEGGFGQVFVAEQQQPVRRTVAVKIIKPGMDSRDVIARFEVERQALAMMDHPNIARVFDAGATEAGMPYFVMELVRGIPITAYCDQNRLATADRVSLFVAVCNAVQHAHQKGIIHRDVKPSNVLVTLHDGVAVVKVIDFGIAKAVNQQLTDRTVYTRFAQFMGTPLYMSPEQAEMSGLDVDTRTDIYSLGVLLYELLTGSTPFDRRRLAEVAHDEVRRIIREEEPLKPSTRLTQSGEELGDIAKHRQTGPDQLQRLVRGDLDWIVMKALEKDRTRRYGTASEFAADLQRHLADEPVTAGPPSLRYRAEKLLRKHRRTVTAAMSLLTSLVLGLVVAVVLYLRAEDLRDVAEQHGRRAALESQRLAESLDALSVERDLKDRAILAQQRELIRSKALLLTAESTAALPRDPGLALLLAREASQRRPRLAAANNAILKALGACHEVHTLLHDDDVTHARFSPDGTRVVTVAANTRLVLWDAVNGRHLSTLDSHACFQNIVPRFSPDGRQLALRFSGAAHRTTASGTLFGFTDHVVRIFDADTLREMLVLRGHTDRVVDVLFTRDGDRLLTASWDGTARMWDRTTGEQLNVFESGGSLAAIKLSPDGQMLLAISRHRDMTLRSHIPWNVDDSSRVPDIVDPPFDARQIEKSTGGASVGMSTRGGGATRPIATVFNLTTGEAHANLAGEGVFQHADFTADGSRILGATNISRLAVWDVDQGRESADLSKEFYRLRDNLDVGMSLGRAVQQFRAAVKDVWDVCRDRRHLLDGLAGRVHVSPDGDYVAKLQGSEADVWATNSGDHVASLRGHAGPTTIESLEFSPDGTRIVTAGGHTSRVWVVSRPSVFLPLEGHRGAIRDAAFATHGNLVTTASEDKSTIVWDPISGRRRHVLKGHRDLSEMTGDRTLGEVRQVNFDHSGRRIVVVSEDPHVRHDPEDGNDRFEHPIPFTPARVWDTNTGQLDLAIPGSVIEDGASILYSCGFTAAAFTPDDRCLVTVDDRVHRYATIRHDGQFASSGRRTVTLSKDEQPLGPFSAVRIWNLADGRQTNCIVSDVTGHPAFLSRDARRAIVVGEVGYQVFDTQSAEAVCVLEEMVHPVHQAYFSNEHRWLVTVGRTILLWNAITGEQVTMLKDYDDHAHRVARQHRLDTPITGAAFYAEDSRLVMVAVDGGASVWGIPTGERLMTLSGHAGPIAGVDVGQRGDWMVTCGEDRTARVWNSHTGLEYLTLPHDQPVTVAALSPAGDQVLTGDAAGRVRLWPLDVHAIAERRTPRNLTATERQRFELE